MAVGRRIVFAVVAFAAMGVLASAEVVTREPDMGQMKEGQRLLVDDGSCGPGKIKEVTGGNHKSVGGTKLIDRKRRCIPRR